MRQFPGVYRRHVLIRAIANGMAADMEDDCHRVGADVALDGAIVTGFDTRVFRIPWTTCPAAAGVLQQLVGTPALPSPYAVLRQVLLREHCTHLLDVAALAISAAGRGIAHRRYAVEIKVGRDGETLVRDAVVERDGQAILHMVVHDDIVIEPARFAQAELRRAASWTKESCEDIDEIEAIFVTARALLVASGRGPDFDEIDALAKASDLPHLTGACFTYEPDRMARADRKYGSIHDFTNRPEALLADLDPDGGGADQLTRVRPSQ